MNTLNHKITDFKALNADFGKHFDKVHETIGHVIEELNATPEERAVST